MKNTYDDILCSKLVCNMIDDMLTKIIKKYNSKNIFDRLKKNYYKKLFDQLYERQIEEYIKIEKNINKITD